MRASKTSYRREAESLIRANNESHDRPAFNLQLARMHLAANDPVATARTWRMVRDAVVDTKTSSTRERWTAAGKQPARAAILDRRLIDTRADHFLAVLKAGTVSTNMFLRRLHNFAVDMRWLTGPMLQKGQWPSAERSPLPRRHVEVGSRFAPSGHGQSGDRRYQRGSAIWVAVPKETEESARPVVREDRLPNHHVGMSVLVHAPSGAGFRD